MTPQQIEAMKLALEALVMYGERHRATYLLGGAWDEEITLGDKAITAIEEALSETQYWSEKYRLIVQKEFEATPPQHTWVGLSDEDMADITSLPIGTCSMMLKVEAKLKEKNT